MAVNQFTQRSETLSKKDRQQEKSRLPERTELEAKTALQALLSGASPQQIPAQWTMQAAGQIGNGAMLSILERSRDRVEQVPYIEAAAPVETAPQEWSGPAFGPALEAPALAGGGEEGAL